MAPSSPRNSLDRTHAPSGFFLLRTPLLPFDELLAWGVEQRGITAADQDVEHELALLRQRLATIVARPEIRQALFVASPSLEEAVTRWLQHPEEARSRETALPVARYFQRMAARCTPFGLFAACSVGAVVNETSLSLAPRASYRTRTRLDNDYLFALCEALGRDEGVRAVLRYRPNTSLYRAGGRLRYAEARLAGRSRSYHLVGIEQGAYLDAVLERASRGATRAELVRTLAEMDPEVVDEAEEFLNELIEAQILVSDLTPAVTGPEPIQHLIELTAGHAPLADARTALEAVRGEIAAMDASGLGHAPGAYRAIARRLEPLPAKLDLARLFQVDTFKPSSATLGDLVLKEIYRALDLATKLARAPKEDRLAPFRKAFTERYEDAEVPLLEVLDEEIGIGFDRNERAHHVPLLDGLGFPSPSSTRGVEETDRWLLGRLFQLGPDAEELVLGEDDIRQLSAGDPIELPDAFGVTCSLHASSTDALQRGDFRLRFDGYWGPSGANTVGRFCHLDPELEAGVRRHLREEEACRPDALFAEIVHLPEGRLGNILARPLLREYELAYLGRSGADECKVLGAEDLLVSVSGKRVTLRSRRLGREVIPRLTTAHAHMNPKNLSVYRFLGALQSQGVHSSWRWTWGMLDNAPRLPRVRCGKVVLAPAAWTLTRSHLEPLAKGSPASRVRALREWRERTKAPRFLALTDEDNELPVDFDNALSLEAFAQIVKNRPSCRLVELISGEDCLVAHGPEGTFFHQMIVPFARRDPSPRRAAKPRHEVHAQRQFLPGDDWLFAKLYTGTATLDELLVEMVAPLVRELVAEGRCDRWFFIRYADPDWHLRLRLRGPREYLRSSVLGALHERVHRLMGDGRVHKMQLDSYHREVERYGGDVGIELAEELFQIDSDAVLALIAVSQEADTPAEARWRLTLRGIDRLLDDLGFDLDAKHAIVGGMRTSFGGEFRVDDSQLKHQLSARFRSLRKKVEATLGDELGAEAALSPAVAVLAERSDRFRHVREALWAASKSGTLTRSVPDLAASFVHMHANRMLHAAARKQELVLYDFLSRVYESRLARRRRAAGHLT
jgi:lantibiotic biosynthesis protein